MGTNHWDVVVVGAGPAGLFAALGTLASGPRDLLIIDSGPDVGDRVRATHAGSSDLVAGVGGAGLFSDGKLCLSLGVGGELGAITTALRREGLLRSVANVFGVSDRLQGSSTQLEAGAGYGEDVEIVPYPVLHIGTEHCATLIRSTRDRVIAMGGTLRANASLRDVRRDRNGVFHLSIAPRHDQAIEITANRVVLALGKVGAQFEEEMSRSLGVSTTPVPMYLGTRLEIDRADGMSLFSGGSDPKLKMHFSDGTKIKTHCAADGGSILSLRYGGLPLAGGHADRSRSSQRSSIGLLWNGLPTGSSSYDDAHTIMASSAALTGGRLLAQRMCDLLNDRASIGRDINRCNPTTSDWAAGDLRNVLPTAYFERLRPFIATLASIAPGVVAERAVLFGPAIEWWMSRIETDQHLQTCVPGLFVAGDGAGWSQGIVHAAATGLLVAEGITGVPFDGRTLEHAAS